VAVTGWGAAAAGTAIAATESTLAGPVLSKPEEQTMKMIGITRILLATGLGVGLGCSMALAQDAGHDAKDAGQATKDAAVDTGHATKDAAVRTAHFTRKVALKTAHRTTVAAKGTAHGTVKVAEKIAGKPDPQ
jgi:hypothetical protein